MGKEIERKFRVKSDAWRQHDPGLLFRQGYLSTVPERTVRVRVRGDIGVLTVKGLTTGASRDEYEYDIPRQDADEMLDNLCERPLIEKTRHRIPLGAHVWEVDEFHGVNRGLVIAEIELASEEEAFELPEWAGEEVTGDPRFYNANLVREPYSCW